MFAEWLASSPLASWLKVFLSAVLTAVLLNIGEHGGEIDFADWKIWVYAGLGALLPVVINFLNPADTRYGNGAGDAVE